MNCRKISRLLSAYQDGELAPAQAQAIASHLHECGACRGEWDGLQELVGRLQHLPPPPADAYFPARVMTALPASRAGKFRLLPAAAYVLVFLAIFLSGFFLQLSSDGTAGTAKPQTATFTAVLLENQDLGLLAVHEETLVLFNGSDHEKK